MHGEIEFRLGFLVAVPYEMGGFYFEAFTFIGQSFDEKLKFAVWKRLFEGDSVAFYDEAGGVHELVGEVAVIG